MRSEAESELIDALALMAALQPFADPQRNDDLFKAWTKARAKAEKCAQRYTQESGSG